MVAWRVKDADVFVCENEQLEAASKYFCNNVVLWPDKVIFDYSVYIVCVYFGSAKDLAEKCKLDYLEINFDQKCLLCSF